MTRWPKIAFAVVFVGYCLPSCFGQCGFKIEPATDVPWYRASGWETPGVADAKSIRKVNLSVDGGVQAWPDGVTVSMLQHDGSYEVRFPKAAFDDHGTRRKMLPGRFQLKWLLRWEINGKPYAYSYELWPNDVACDATIDIIDDKGDGKFRLMTSPGHLIVNRHPTPPPVPEWAKKPAL